MIRLALRVRRDHAELVLAELIELAPSGVEEVDAGDGMVEYAVYGAPGELPALPDLRAAAGEAFVDVSTTELADDWTERWRQFHRALIVEPSPGTGGPSLRVRPPWEPPLAAADILDIVIDPGQAFGTGAHATTRLCLEFLLEIHADLGTLRAGPVLDIGCGSGVLGIAAARLGFAPVLGLDHERESVQATTDNAAVNEVEVEVRRFDLRHERPPGGYPIVVANLLRPLLLELAGRLTDVPEHVVAGGLLEHEADEVSAAFAARGLGERARRGADGWASLWLTAAATR